MLTVYANRSFQGSCDGLSRRDFLRVGALGLGGLSLADVLRLRARGAVADRAAPKSVIMMYLWGGPSHLDMYDLKPNAPAEIRGEFKPIPTNVPGMEICELMPLQAKIADKLSIVRGVRFVRDGHDAEEVMRGVVTGPVKRPVFGSVVSRKFGAHRADGMPRYVALGGDNGSDPADPAYLGTAHKPFNGASGNLRLHPSVSLDRLADRKELLRAFDGLQRTHDTRQGDLAGVDTFTAQALEMITSRQVRDAFDVNQEPESVRARYGKGLRLLQARRLVEAGVSVVTLSIASTILPFTWDSHGNDAGRKIASNFDVMRANLPGLDQYVHALLTDLGERGLDKDVLVVLWGEMGRTPKINQYGGRDHWTPAAFVIVAGGGLQMGQVIGDTGPRGDRERGRSTPYSPQSVLATVYHVLGIDPTTTLPDHSGRPQYLLEEPDKISELL